LKEKIKMIPKKIAIKRTRIKFDKLKKIIGGEIEKYL
jgi:hypothetical protein